MTLIFGFQYNINYENSVFYYELENVVSSLLNYLSKGRCNTTTSISYKQLFTSLIELLAKEYGDNLCTPNSSTWVDTKLRGILNKLDVNLETRLVDGDYINYISIIAPEISKFNSLMYVIYYYNIRNVLRENILLEDNINKNFLIE